MFFQLMHAGVLGRCRAIVLGDFSPVPAQATDNGFGLASAIAQLRGRIDVPVLTGLPFGHVPRKLTLPVGARARLRAQAGRIDLTFGGHPTVAG
jgi:muramoyltetrapeptide carboxypeptidase